MLLAQNLLNNYLFQEKAKKVVKGTSETITLQCQPDQRQETTIEVSKMVILQFDVEQVIIIYKVVLEKQSKDNKKSGGCDRYLK